jgi:hypothetical protein
MSSALKTLFVFFSSTYSYSSCKLFPCVSTGRAARAEWIYIIYFNLKIGNDFLLSPMQTDIVTTINLITDLEKLINKTNPKRGFPLEI